MGKGKGEDGSPKRERIQEHTCECLREQGHREEHPCCHTVLLGALFPRLHRLHTHPRVSMFTSAHARGARVGRFPKCVGKAERGLVTWENHGWTSTSYRGDKWTLSSCREPHQKEIATGDHGGDAACDPGRGQTLPEGSKSRKLQAHRDGSSARGNYVAAQTGHSGRRVGAEAMLRELICDPENRR